MDSDSNEPIKNDDNLNAPAPPPSYSESNPSPALPPSAPSENNPPASFPVPADGEVKEEKKSTKKSMAIKISLGLLVIVLILVGYVGFKMYKQMKQMKEVFNYVQEMSNYAAPTDLPIPRREKVSSPELNPRTSRLFGSEGIVNRGDNSGMPTFSMNKDDTKTFVENARKIDGEKIMKALNKYSERPIVKEFINDLKKEPEFQKALEAKDTNNPIAVISSVNKIKNMKGIVGKYAMRPDFMKLMMEIMQDPEMAPLFKMMPGGAMPNLSDSDIKNMQNEMKKQPGGEKIEERK